MKKIILALIATAALLMTGCQSTSSSSTDDRNYSIQDNGTTSSEETTANNNSSDNTDNTSKNEETKASSTNNNDSIDSVSNDKFAYTIHDNCIDIDSDKGPYYIISLDNYTVIDCTSTGAKVVDYKKDGNTLTLTLYSDEYPVNSTYVIDLTKSTTDTITSQSISNNILKFSTSKGPDYEINLTNMTLVSCSDSTGRIVSSNLNCSKLTLIVYSATLPVDMTYEFTIK